MTAPPLATAAPSTPGSWLRGRFAARRALVVAALAAALAVVLAASPARAQKRAKLIDLYGSVVAGGMTGGGSEDQTSDFFHDSQGLATGVNLGLRLLIIDFSVRFLQTFDSNGASDTLSTVMLGPSVEIPVVGGGHDSLGRPRPVQVVIRPGLAAALAFGTASPVSLPLNNEQLSSKGLMVLGRFAVERLFGPFFGIGAELQSGYHYMLADAVNGPHSQGWQLAVFTTASVHLGI